MIVNLFENFQVFKSGLSKCLTRNQLISSNIANAETEGYVSKDVFVSKLGEARADREINFTVKNRDDAKVDVEKEMALLVENSIEYNSLVQAITKEYKKMEYVINEGR